MRFRALAAAFVSTGCVPQLPDPTLHSVDPVWGYNGEETLVSLTGRNFLPRVQASGVEQVDLDHDFRVFLKGPGEAELEGVELVSYSSIEARVPEGLDPGVYDLTLQSPAGEETQLSDSFTVTDTRADHLELTVDMVTYEVNALARVEVQVLGPEDGDIALPLGIQVEVSGQSGATGVQFEQSLENQQTLDEGVGISGDLGANGMGFFALTSAISEELWITVSPSNEDSVVQSDTQFLVFTSGDVSRVRVDLPDDFEGVVAGDQFPVQITLLDAWDNQTEGVTAALTMTEACGEVGSRYEQTIQLVDTELVEDAYATGATNTAACPENRFYVSGTASGTFVEGSSEPFALEPGEATGLGVEVSPSEAVAGGDPLYVRVEAQDSWHNPVPDFAESISLKDDAGGLDSDGAMGEQSCTEFSEGLSFCQAWPWKAGDEITLTATSETGLEGVASPVRIIPGEAKEMVVDLDSSTVEAGTEYGLVVRVLDAFGNAIQLDIEGVDDPTFTGTHETTSCTYVGPGVPAGSDEFSCTSTTADDALEIRVAIDALDIDGLSDLLTVTNGPLATASLDIGGVTSIVAGESVAVEVSTMDVYGNPYLVQTTSSVSLYDQSGEITGEVLALDPSGQSSADSSLTRAISGNAFVVRDGLTTLGTSSEFDVLASSMDAFEVATASSWTWVDTGLEVEVTAVDSYGNVVEGYDDTVTLSSKNTLGIAVTLDAFSDGIATASFLYLERGLQDVLMATDGIYSGSSSALDALEICEEGPIASIALAGQEELIQCLVSGATPTISIDSSGTSIGASALEAWHFDTGDEDWVRSSSATLGYSWTSEGRWEVTVVAVDQAACGSTASAYAWIAENDGEPAGPINVESDSDSMIAGSSTSGRVTVDVDATDCTGDPSAGGTLLVRTDLGEIDTTSGMASSTGAGLVVTLDGDGLGSFDWTVEAQEYSGEGTLYLGVESGAAYGSIQADVTGDSVSPFLRQVDPSGTTGESILELEVLFSEPMLESSLDTSTVVLIDPDGIEVAFLALDLSSDGDELIIDLEQAADASAGVWTFELDSNIRDSAGNRLDGRYTGSRSDFSLDFGDVLDDSQDISSCSASYVVFVPDGDDGSDEEADELQLAFSTASVPAWWEIEILDEAGESVWLTRDPAVLASSTASWDGRGFNGLIVPSGSYSAVIFALDTYWNTGVGCTLDVEVAQHLEAPD